MCTKPFPGIDMPKCISALYPEISLFVSVIYAWSPVVQMGSAVDYGFHGRLPPLLLKAQGPQSPEPKPHTLKPTLFRHSEP